MGKKKSPKSSSKGKSAASKSATSIPRASASSPPPHGGSSSSDSTPPSAAVSASPPLGASDSPIPMATRSPVNLVPPRAAIGDSIGRSVQKHIIDLRNAYLYENALEQLAKKTTAFRNMAPFLWFSFGTITLLLQEVVSIYKKLSHPLLTLEQTKRVCNAIALFQCVASHPETRILFVRANIPFYFYPFLNIMGESRPCEHLRLASLEVISALVKVPDARVMLFLLHSEIMPLCLCAMEHGTESSKTVATFILQRILQDDLGLWYVGDLPERSFAVCRALGNVVASLSDQPSVRLLEQVIRCYRRLLDNQRSLQAVRNSFPTKLSDGTFDHCLREDQTARILQELLDNVLGRPHITQEGSIINMSTWILSILMYLKMRQLCLQALTRQRIEMLSISFHFIYYTRLCLIDLLALLSVFCIFALHVYPKVPSSAI